MYIYVYMYVYIHIYIHIFIIDLYLSIPLDPKNPVPLWLLFSVHPDYQCDLAKPQHRRGRGLHTDMFTEQFLCQHQAGRLNGADAIQIRL